MHSIARAPLYNQIPKVRYWWILINLFPNLFTWEEIVCFINFTRTCFNLYFEKNKNRQNALLTWARPRDNRQVMPTVLCYLWKYVQINVNAIYIEFQNAIISHLEYKLYSKFLKTWSRRDMLLNIEHMWVQYISRKHFGRILYGTIYCVYLSWTSHYFKYIIRINNIIMCTILILFKLNYFIFKVAFKH